MGAAFALDQMEFRINSLPGTHLSNENIIKNRLDRPVFERIDLDSLRNEFQMTREHWMLVKVRQVLTFAIDQIVVTLDFSLFGIFELAFNFEFQNDCVEISIRVQFY